jgi:hypothetical protein
VEAVDVTSLMLEMLETELEKFLKNEQGFVDEFTQEDFNYLKQVCNSVDIDKLS